MVKSFISKLFQGKTGAIKSQSLLFQIIRKVVSYSRLITHQYASIGSAAAECETCMVTMTMRTMI